MVDIRNNIINSELKGIESNLKYIMPYLLFLFYIFFFFFTYDC